MWAGQYGACHFGFPFAFESLTWHCCCCSCCCHLPLATCTWINQNVQKENEKQKCKLQNHQRKATNGKKSRMNCNSRCKTIKGGNVFLLITEQNSHRDSFASMRQKLSFAGDFTLEEIAKLAVEITMKCILGLHVAFPRASPSSPIHQVQVTLSADAPHLSSTCD